MYKLLVLYYLIYWPLEDCVTVVKENALQQGKKCEVGEECSVKYCGKVVTGIVAGIGKWCMFIIIYNKYYYNNCYNLY